MTGNFDTKGYNGTEHTVSGWSEVNGLVAGDTLVGVSGNAAGTDVGEYIQVISDAQIADADGNDMTGNYEISCIDGKLTINPARVVVTVDAEKVYDGTTPYDPATGNHTITLTGDESGLLDAEDFTLQSFEFSGKNAGSYSDVDGTVGDTLFHEEYDPANFVIEYHYNGLIRPTVIIVEVKAEKVYDATTTLDSVETEIAVEGGIEGDDVAFKLESMQAEYADANVHSDLELAELEGELGGSDRHNYVLVLTGTGSITPRHVTVTAERQHKHVGEEDPELTWVHTDGILLEGDAIDGTLVREPGEEVGVYTIYNDTLQVNNPNYILHYVENVLHIRDHSNRNWIANINEWMQPYIYNLNYTMSTTTLGPGSLGFYWEPRGIYRFEAPNSLLDPIPDGENSVSGSLTLRSPDESLEDYLEIGGVKWETVLNRLTIFKDDIELLLDEYIDDSTNQNSRDEALISNYSRALY